MELEFATTQEILKELLSRTTFAGILIKSSKEVTSKNMELDEWEIFIKGIGPKHAKEMLGFVAERLKEME